MNDTTIEDSLKDVAAAKAVLERTEEAVASMNRICEMIRETNLLKVQDFSDEDAVFDMEIEKLLNALTQRNEAPRTSPLVSFVPEDTIVLVESRHVFSETEKKRCWYSREEAKKTKKLYKAVAERLESGKGNSRQLCGRGLEAVTTKGKEMFSASVDACRSAVIDEQEIQRSNDRTDHDQLAIVSQEASKHSIEQAVKLAMEDYNEARKVYKLKVEQDPIVSKKDGMQLDRWALSSFSKNKDYYSRGARGAGRIVPYLGHPKSPPKMRLNRTS